MYFPSSVKKRYERSFICAVLKHFDLKDLRATFIIFSLSSSEAIFFLNLRESSLSANDLQSELTVEEVTTLGNTSILFVGFFSALSLCFAPEFVFLNPLNKPFFSSCSFSLSLSFIFSLGPI